MKNNPERKESASAANGTAHLRIQGKPSVAEVQQGIKLSGNKLNWVKMSNSFQMSALVK